MLVDPQRYNLYAYTRNNPLRFVDPSGESIELLGDEEKRKKQLEALRSAVGEKAGAYLYENKITDENGNTRYFVGINGGPSGKRADFFAINNVASGIGRIIDDKRIASITIVEPGFRAVSSEDPSVVRTVGPLRPGVSPAVTDSASGQIYLLDPRYDYGSLPGSVMSDRMSNKLDAAITLGHELGHIDYAWGLAIGPSRDAAVGLENMVRRLRDPNGPKRIRHDPGDPEIGKGEFVIRCPGCAIR